MLPAKWQIAMEEAHPGFARLARLLRAGYTVEGIEGTECVFLAHPAGRKYSQWKLMAYSSGTIVGMNDMRLRSFDDDAFNQFLGSIPKV